MGNDGNRTVVERYVAALEKSDLGALDRLRHADFTLDMPQTRERIVGRENVRAVDEHYPGGLPEGAARRVTGAEDRWIVDASWVPRRVAGSGDVWAVEATLRYPDGSMWALASIIELHDGLIVRETNYYAPFTPAPEWRSQWVVPLPEDG